MEIPYSEPCERNKDPILTVLSTHFDSAKSVLEVGSGTGQHAVYFSQHKPHLSWQTSDRSEYLDGIHAQLSVADVGNVVPPIQLDVNQPVWVESGATYDLVYTANTFHIMAEPDVEAFYAGLPTVLKANGKLVVYGPFKYGGKFTSESNAAFDQRLRDRGVGSGIRDVEWLNEMAETCGLVLLSDHSMPANNQCLIWERKDEPH